MSASPKPIDLAVYMQEVGRNARLAGREVARAATAVKNAALHALANRIEQDGERLMIANRQDLEQARAAGLDEALLDRLALTEKGVAAMADGVRQVAALPDPVGEITDLKMRPSGIQVGRMRVPLGVVGIIYESRPNVTADAAALCLKSGNAVILRGGSEAWHSNQAIAICLHAALAETGLPETAAQVLATTDRDAVGHLVAMSEWVDVIVPRGGRGLIERVAREARVPVIKHLDGVCHVYIDAAADRDKALRIALNAKTQRYGTCNTMETLLVDAAVATDLLPELGMRLAKAGVSLRGCSQTCALLPGAEPATRRIGTPNTWRPFSRSVWSMDWTPPSTTSIPTALVIPMPS